MNLDAFFLAFPDLYFDPSSQSITVPHEHLLDVIDFLMHDPSYGIDYVSNITGIDWLAKKEKQKNADGIELEVEKKGFLEVVYHLYSVEKKHGPIVLRCRTDDRISPMIPSIKPLLRGAEFQEREIYDLYGIIFSGHPDLRRILMWDEFRDYPMRKDYIEPDDYEYEPTPHDTVLLKAKKHYEKAGGKL